MICIFTDGSSLGNPGRAGAAVSVVRNDTRYSYYGIPLAHATNNAAELTAAKIALEQVPKCTARWQDERIVIFTDSQYVISCLKNATDWATMSDKHNIELIKECARLLQENDTQVTLKWVRGHTGSHSNEFCDRLAKKVAKEQEEAIWSMI